MQLGHISARGPKDSRPLRFARFLAVTSDCFFVMGMMLLTYGYKVNNSGV